jgi:hypothetical protein
MKKLFAILVVACATLMVSCVSVESKANYFAEKMANADGWSAKSEVEAEMDKYLEGLSAEEEAQFEEVFSNKYKAIMKERIKAGMKDLFDGAESYAKEAAAAVEAAAEVVAEESDDYVKAAKDAAEAYTEAAVEAAEEYAKEIEKKMSNTEAMDQAAEELEKSAEKAAEAVNNALNALFE